MDQEEIKKSIVERFNNLQPEIQKAIMDPDYEQHVYNIAKKYNLSTEQTEEFESDTTLVMLGQIHPNDYNETLVDDLNLPADKINEIVNDVNEKILKPIRDLLKNNFEEDDRIESELINIPTPPYAKTEVKIEAPKVDEAPKNIIEEKLKNQTTSNNTVSDYTIPKISTNTSPSNDPYHEPIE